MHSVATRAADAPALRIAFYNNLLASHKRSHGGVRQWTLTMANALVERGHAVDMLVEAPQSRFVDEPLLDARVRRVILGNGIAAWLRLRQYVQQHPGVRLVAALDYYNLRAAKLKRRFGDRVHVMLTQRENLSADMAWRKPLKYWWNTLGVRRYFNRADAVVTVSKGLATDLRDNWGVAESKLHTIYNPAFRPGVLELAKQPVDHPWFTDKRSPIVLAAGRLHYVKGFDDLLRAFALLRQRIDVRLVILGEGKEREPLTALVESLGLADSVALPGRVANAAAWMARADVFALSSRREGLPAVLIEALAVGLPIVATRCPSGPDEILEADDREARWGSLVDVGDAPQMAAALHAALSSARPDRAVLRARAEAFSLDRALQQYLALWHVAPLASAD
ncbi:MAG: hypothetical protein JWR16_3628 [Nevskia sp.]|nr:hypothetical protein [Nevskia sp.]